jgi:hypothetical protein
MGMPSQAIDTVKMLFHTLLICVVIGTWTTWGSPLEFSSFMSNNNLTLILQIRNINDGPVSIRFNDGLWEGHIDTDSVEVSCDGA